MNESNSIEVIDKTNLTNQTKFWLDEISKTDNYFIEEINQRKSFSKKLTKYVAVFDYIDQALIVLSAASGEVSIISFASIVGAPVGIASASLTLLLLNITRNKKKKHHKILMLAKSKLNSIETLALQALIDMEISHEKFITILKEKDKYEKMKDNLRRENEKYEIMRRSSVKSKTWVKNYWVFHAIKKFCFFSCVCIKWFKSAKKDIKNVKLKLLTKILLGK